MVKKGNLFFLIKSLSKSEKRYFRMNAGNNNVHTNYIRLFDFIVKQTEVDDEAIKTHFKGEKFIRQLHVAKIYLYELIMKSLRNYSSNTSVYGQILDKLREVEILFEKELFDQCSLQLQKAEHLANKFEHEALLLDIQSWKRSVTLAIAKSEPSKMNKIIEAEKSSIHKLSEINYFWEQTSELYLNFKDKDLLTNIRYPNPKTLRAQSLMLHLKYTHSFVNGEINQAEAAISELIELHIRQPHRIQEEPAPYVTAISNKISLLIGQRRWMDIDELIADMREVPERFQLKHEHKFTMRLWLRIFNLELEVYRDTNQFVQAVELIQEIEHFMKDKESAIPETYLIMLNFQIASLQFAMRNLKGALASTNKILNVNYGETRVDLQCYAHILNLAVHFELNNIIILRYAVDGARRFFKKKKFVGEYPLTVLKLFSKLSTAYPLDYQVIYKEFITQIANFPTRELQSGLDYFDAQEWLKGKIKNLS